MPQSILITGSAGFIGSHLRQLLLDDRGNRSVTGLDLEACAGAAMFRADIRHRRELQSIASTICPSTVVHLAAKAEVVFPFDELGDLMTTNVNGTINVLDVMRPQRVVLASSSAVYGNAGGRASRARWSAIRPIGAYGMSKAAAELACGDWVRQTGGIAVCLRFGNVIGERCRGLIAYLVSHALAHPAGGPPAQLRGDGLLVRDYVPVRYATAAIKAAAEIRLPAGTSTIFNVGSGRGLTNRAVAGIVRGVLARRGFELEVEFGRAVAPGEAWRIVLDTDRTARRLGLPPPTEDDVVAAIEAAALSYLRKAD